MSLASWIITWMWADVHLSQGHLRSWKTLYSSFKSSISIMHSSTSDICVLEGWLVSIEFSHED